MHIIRACKEIKYSNNLNTEHSSEYQTVWVSGCDNDISRCDNDISQCDNGLQLGKLHKPWSYKHDYHGSEKKDMLKGKGEMLQS